MILFINTCVRPESRTLRLAHEVLKHISPRSGFPSDDGSVREIRPGNEPLTNEMLTYRTELANKGLFNDPIFDDARLFASADEIVIAAPYWDLSFPASLKCYIEAINITGITFAYTPDGIPYGLCKARRLIYVTTAGGQILSDAYGYGYIRELALSYYGIPDTLCIKAEGLDIIGNDPEAILQEAIRSIKL